MKTHLLICCTLSLIIASSVYGGDSCGSPILGVHGTGAEQDTYGFFADFSGTTHTMYWDWINPDTSLSDSTSTCQPPINAVGAVLLCNGTLDGCVLGSTGADFSNNNSCPMITGCDGLDDNGTVTGSDRMVVAVYTTTTTATYTSKFLVDSVNYDETQSHYSFNASSPGAVRHQLFTMVRPDIQSASIVNGNIVRVTVAIPEPIFNSAGTTGGLYGNGSVADDLLAGYKVVAVQTNTEPANGLASNYNIAISDGDRYVPATRPPNGGTKVSNQIDIPFSLGSHLWVAWVPVFNYSGSGCSTAVCTAAQVQVLDQGGGGLGSNSLSARIASPPRQVQVTPVTFVYFRGTWSRAHRADLEWKTATETDTAGFNLYRSSDGGVTWKKLNQQLIPAQGQGGAGATYAYTDVFPKIHRIRAWHYRVDAIDINNEVTGSLTALVQRDFSR